MLKRVFIGVVTLSFGVALLMGCDSNPAKSASSGEPAQPMQASSAPNPAATTPPAALSNSAELAENVYDAVWTKDWSGANAKFQQLQASGAQAQQSISGINDVSAKMSELQAALQAKDHIKALRASNELTGAFTSAMRPYQNKVPVDVMKLDYLGRRLQVDAAAKDMTAAKTTIMDLTQTWDVVRPAVVQKNGNAEATSFDALVKKINAANSSKALAADAASALEQVDKLEAVFTKA